MYESNHDTFNLTAHNWLQVLAYLALPILIFGLGVVWPIFHATAQTSDSAIDSTAYRPLTSQR